MPTPHDRHASFSLASTAAEAEPEGGVSRRTALQGLAGSLAAALAAMAGAEAHPIAAHLAQRSKPRDAGKPRQTTAPLFLDTHQFATLGLVADLVVPGSVASESPRFIDEVLAVETHDVQRHFVQALGAIDASARDRHQRAFRQLSRDAQMGLLEDAARQSSASDRRADAGHDRPSDEAARALQHLKTWIAGAHYSSEAGMKELGWTGGMFFPTYTGCTHPEGHS